MVQVVPVEILALELEMVVVALVEMVVAMVLLVGPILVPLAALAMHLGMGVGL
jgi:hypothetical protein